MASETAEYSLVEKVLLILETLSASLNGLSAAEISKITTINRTTTYRIIKEMMSHGWVIHNKAMRKYVIGPMAFHVGTSYNSDTNLENKMTEVLEKLGNELEVSVGYAVREGDQVISMFEYEAHLNYKMKYRPGRIYCFNKGAYGKCLFAYADQRHMRNILSKQKFEKNMPNVLTEVDDIIAEYAKIREQGYAISIEEVGPHICGVGVPVFNKAGEARGSFASAFLLWNDERDDEKIKKTVKAFQRAAEEVKNYII